MLKIQKGSVAVLIPVLIVVVTMAAAYGVSKFKKKDDTVAEELLETVAEKSAEKILGLEDGELEGRMDATPDSKEDKK